MEEFELKDFADKASPGNQLIEEVTKVTKGIDKPCLEERDKRGFVQWAETFKNTYTATGKVERQLPPGLYKISMDNKGNFYFEKQPIKTDETIRFSESLADEILKEIENFWRLRELYESNKFLHRRGYLLYGPQGSGKSIIVQQIIEGVIQNKGVAIWMDSYPDERLAAIQVLRIVELDRPILVIFEDIDAIITKYGDSGLLSFLDGEGQTDKILCLATTNYPEKLDKRIVARPRRFDRVIKIGTPSSTVRREYFRHKVKDLSEEQLEQWVTSTSGFSFAALADLIISVKCFKYSFDDAVEKLRKLLDATPSSEEFKVSKTGF